LKSIAAGPENHHRWRGGEILLSRQVAIDRDEYVKALTRECEQFTVALSGPANLWNRGDIVT